MTKKECRDEMARRRDALPPERRRHLTARIRRRLEASPAWQQSGNVLVYLAIGSEVETGDIVQEALRAGKDVYAPKVQGKGLMEGHRIVDLGTLERGPYGIPEPPAGERRDVFDLVLVPGLAFDRTGSRIGYGGGFYDRFLTLHRPSFAVGLAFGVQLADGLITEPHDVRLDAVIVDGIWVRCSDRGD